MRAATLLASLLFVFAVGEVGIRLQALAKPKGTPPQKTTREVSGLPQILKPSDLLPANVLAQHRGVVYRTNSTGMRGPDYPREAAAGVVRIGIVGDSVTAGWGVEEEDTYVYQLAEMLNAESRGRDFEVLNFGMAGLNAETAMARLAKYDSIYRPTLLVYGFTPNDIEGRNSRSLFSPDEHDEWKTLSLRPIGSRSALYRNVVKGVRSLREMYWPPRGSRHAELVFNYRENPAAWRDFERALDELKETGGRGDRCVQVLIHTQLTNLGLLHPYAVVYELVSQAATARGFRVTETLSDYRFRDERSLWVGRFDPHPNRAGHRILARALADDILALPDDCFDRPQSEQPSKVQTDQTDT